MRLKQFDGLTWLTLTTHILRQIYTPLWTVADAAAEGRDADTEDGARGSSAVRGGGEMPGRRTVERDDKKTSANRRQASHLTHSFAGRLWPRRSNTRNIQSSIAVLLVSAFTKTLIWTLNFFLPSYCFSSPKEVMRLHLSVRLFVC